MSPNPSRQSTVRLADRDNGSWPREPILEGMEALLVRAHGPGIVDRVWAEEPPGYVRWTLTWRPRTTPAPGAQP